MPSTFSPNNGIELQATGENNSTWGARCNDNSLSLIDTSLDGWIGLALAGASSSIAISDGAVSDGRNRVLVCTGALAANHTVLVTPNDAKKVYFVVNNTTGGFAVIIAQGGGSGTTATVPYATTRIVRVDGTGTNANAIDLGPTSVTSITGTTDQVTASASTGPVTLSLPQSIATTSSPAFSRVQFADGTAALPSATFSSDTNTGIYSSAADQIGFSIGGALKSALFSQGWTVTGRYLAIDGDCTISILPLNAGAGRIGTTASNALGFTTDSVTRLTIAAASGALTSSTGASLTSGGTWANASDIALKDSFSEVSHRLILQNLARMPIRQWCYKAEEGVFHIGPTSQDFQNAFGYGGDDKGISTVDGIGVALAAIQALHYRIENTWWRRALRFICRFKA